MKNYLIASICGLFIFLVGCQSRTPDSHGLQSAALINHCEDLGYCYQVSSVLKKAVGENDIAVYYTSNESSGTHYHVQPYHLNSPCNTDLMGISKTTVLADANGQTTWGRVDYYDNGKNIYNANPDPICRPPSLGGMSKDDAEKFIKSRSAYALCSEKDGKTVVICISQMTDNPKLAEDIFKTFRWTK